MDREKEINKIYGEIKKIEDEFKEYRKKSEKIINALEDQIIYEKNKSEGMQIELKIMNEKIKEMKIYIENFTNRNQKENNYIVVKNMEIEEIIKYMCIYDDEQRINLFEALEYKQQKEIFEIMKIYSIRPVRCDAFRRIYVDDFISQKNIKEIIEYINEFPQSRTTEIMLLVIDNNILENVWMSLDNKIKTKINIGSELWSRLLKIFVNNEIKKEYDCEFDESTINEFYNIINKF